jgi:DNA polymerase bacteriophage-type
MNLTVLDFETYYDAKYSLKKLSIPEYVHDPRFHVHGLAIRRPDGATEFVVDVPSALRRLQAEFGPDLERTIVVCHNAQFDLYILNHRYGIRPRFFIDTMFLAYHVHGRRERGEGQDATLGALARLYGLPAKGDIGFMCGVRNQDARQAAALTDYACHDAELTFQLCMRLIPLVTRPDVELRIAMHTVRLFTERGILIDQAGIGGLEKRIGNQTKTFLDAAKVTKEAVANDEDFNRLLEEALVRTGRKVPLKRGKRGWIPATAKKDAAMLALQDDDDDVVAALANVRLNLKGETQQIARLGKLQRIAAATGGVLPPCLVYYGCHTGRFAGSGGLNIQNLPKQGLGGDVRRLLIARPGHVFIMADFAQIEARITAWFAGQEDQVEAFRAGRDQYSEFASETLHSEVRKPKDDDPLDLRDQLKARRQVGKTAVLGLGFGLGALTFMNRLLADRATAGLFDSGVLSSLICRDIVSEYRQRFPLIEQFWNDLDQAARAAVDGCTPSLGGLRFDRDGEVVRCWLPSGRALRYPRLRLVNTPRTIRFLGVNGEQAEFTPDGPSLVYGRDTVLYGGKLCENVVQATARDLLVEAILRLERLGFPVLFHVHDEVIVEVTTERAEEAKVAVGQELNRIPAWASGLPIACEVRQADNYHKS